MYLSLLVPLDRSSFRRNRRWPLALSIARASQWPGWKLVEVHALYALEDPTAGLGNPSKPDRGRPKRKQQEQPLSGRPTAKWVTSVSRVSAIAGRASLGSAVLSPRRWQTASLERGRAPAQADLIVMATQRPRAR